MNNKRCNKRRLSISSVRIIEKIKLNPHLEALIDAAIRKQTPLPSAPSCNFETTRNLIMNLREEYTSLGQHLTGIIASEQLKIEANQKELDELKKCYNAMKIREAETKRTRWCNWCEQEASFLSCKAQFFYCSTKCEEQHLDALF